MKKGDLPEISTKNTEEVAVIVQAAAHSPDTLLADLGNLKLKAMKQVDTLSEQLLNEFQKLSQIREAITLEQQHLQELYQINETAHTLAALLQTQTEQKETFKQNMEHQSSTFESEMNEKKAFWKAQSELLEQGYKEQKEKLEKTRKREEEEYTYMLEIKHRKEMDEYNNRKAILEKELIDLKADMIKREADIAQKEKAYETLSAQVDHFPITKQEAVTAAEATLRAQLLQQHQFETQMKQKEYEAALQLSERSASYLESKIKGQETLIKELTQKADMATQQIQSIACRALETSAQRFVYTSAGDEK